MRCMEPIVQYHALVRHQLALGNLEEILCTVMTAFQLQLPRPPIARKNMYYACGVLLERKTAFDRLEAYKVRMTLQMLEKG